MPFWFWLQTFFNKGTFTLETDSENENTLIEKNLQPKNEKKENSHIGDWFQLSSAKNSLKIFNFK